MASNEDKRSTTTEQENRKDTQPNKIRIENPFIAFRRFADEKIGSALQSIIGLPSAVTKQLGGALPGLDTIRNENARHREEAESFREKLGREYQEEASEEQAPQDLIEELKRHREQHRKKWERIRDAIHQGPDASHASSMTDNDRERIVARAMGFPPPQHNDAKPEQDVQNSIIPRHAVHGLVDLFFATDIGRAELNPLSTGLFSRLITNLSTDSVLPYIMFSPYSPLFLSNNSHMSFASKRHIPDPFPYCDAFEDLLLASRGMNMVPLEERRRRQTPPPSSDIRLTMSWLSRLQNQGLLEGTLLSEESSDEDDGTELAMYKRFLSSAFPKPTPQISSKETVTTRDEEVIEEVNHNKKQHLPNNPILSTLTQTETTRFPDGRIETKVSLIKRFADGAESRTETVHTNNEGSTSNQGVDLEVSTKNTKDEKKGWFWN